MDLQNAAGQAVKEAINLEPHPAKAHRDFKVTDDLKAACRRQEGELLQMRIRDAESGTDGQRAVSQCRSIQRACGKEWHHINSGTFSPRLTFPCSKGPGGQQEGRGRCEWPEQQMLLSHQGTDFLSG